MIQMIFQVIALFLYFCRISNASMHPITIRGRHFVDSVSGEVFYIKGVDYQPGGSSKVSENSDPLSDPETCARDIILFQDLGINTIRVYSVNSNLNHDKCMSMLATAGIYLVLDINSPLPFHHLNRYEPWTTYTEKYFSNIFKVVEQFSHYNNTLGFFAGNEVVNDRLSAKYSPGYVKALIRDLKTYIEKHSPRFIPVGYSAADDLKYRVSFSNYLECIETSYLDSIDFYGVNSYQWCGEQTFYTSGYNELTDSYKGYSKPVFLSEYGCNEVVPRLFEEVNPLYSDEMKDVFSGGLVYEFTQESNNYGLVEIIDNGNVILTSDYLTLKSQLEAANKKLRGSSMNKKNGRGHNRGIFEVPNCGAKYRNIEVSSGMPESVADILIAKGVQVKRGLLSRLSDEELVSKKSVFTERGNLYNLPKSIKRVIEFQNSDLQRGINVEYPNGKFDSITHLKSLSNITGNKRLKYSRKCYLVTLFFIYLQL